MKAKKISLKYAPEIKVKINVFDQSIEPDIYHLWHWEIRIGPNCYMGSSKAYKTKRGADNAAFRFIEKVNFGYLYIES